MAEEVRGIKRFLVGSQEELRRRKLLPVTVEGREIVVVSLPGEVVVAYEAVCLHQGGPLAQGRVLSSGLECPWHGCLWELETGRLAGQEGVCLKRYPVAVLKEKVYVSVAQDL